MLVSNTHQHPHSSILDSRRLTDSLQKKTKQPLAQKFHELNQAYELLLDPLRRLALNSSVKAAEARKARFSKLDKRKREMQEALDIAERAAKKPHNDAVQEARRREQENERVKEAGRKMREERLEAMRRQEAEETQDEHPRGEEEEVPPLGELLTHLDHLRSFNPFSSLGQLDTTIKLKYTLQSRPELTTTSAIATLLTQFGDVDTSSIVLSLKPPKKAPTKPPKYGTALVPFRQIGSAFAAVGASGRKERGLENVEVSWAGGEEPPILGWLKKQGKLKPSTEESSDAIESLAGSTPQPNLEKQSKLFDKLSEKPVLSSFPSFPASFVRDNTTIFHDCDNTHHHIVIRTRLIVKHCTNIPADRA